MNAVHSTDKVTNIVQQIKRGIRVCLEHGCLGSAVILVYSGIDAMTYVGLPSGRDSVKGSDFASWADRYISLCKDGRLTGSELYSARCAMLHTYGVASRKTKEGKCRQIGYMDNSEPPVRCDPSDSQNFVLVSVKHLVDAFIQGVDEFLIDLFADQTRKIVAEKRFDNLCMLIPT